MLLAIVLSISFKVTCFTASNHSQSLSSHISKLFEFPSPYSSPLLSPPSLPLSQSVCMLLAFAYSLIWLVWQLRPILQNVICQGRLAWFTSPKSACLPATHWKWPHKYLVYDELSGLKCAQPHRQRERDKERGRNRDRDPSELCQCAMSRVVWICLVWSGGQRAEVKVLYFLLSNCSSWLLAAGSWQFTCSVNKLLVDLCDDLWAMLTWYMAFYYSRCRSETKPYRAFCSVRPITLWKQPILITTITTKRSKRPQQQL